MNVCLECERPAKERIVLWNEALDGYEDCGVRCGVHSRKYTRLGFHRCRLEPVVIRMSFSMRWYGPGMAS